MGSNRVKTGLVDLDEILNGGLIRGNIYLLRGGPGIGKTTFGFHYLTHSKSEKNVFITFTEKSVEIQKNAKKMGFDLSGVRFLDLIPGKEVFVEDETYNLFYSSEVENGNFTEKIVEFIEKEKPDKIFIDSITQYQYMMDNDYQYRKQILSFFEFLKNQKATVIITSEISNKIDDDDLQFLTDGIIELKSENEIRKLKIKKFRGSSFSKGWHHYKITHKGIIVFPILRPKKYSAIFTKEKITSGVSEIDNLLHGGFTEGTSTLISGPAGVGKTTFGTLFMKEAASRGERSVIFLFDENKETFLHRCESVQIPVKSMINKGTLKVYFVEPLEYSTHQFSKLLKIEAENENTNLIMIDSVKGYELALRGEDIKRDLTAKIRYLKNMGKTVLLISEMGKMSGDVFKITDSGISYIADNVVFLKYVEWDSKLHKTIGVLKQRTSGFENSLREFKITKDGVKVGSPLHNMQRILSGTPIKNNKNKI
ncbi:MAG: recombinase RecA [Candidatus Mcinerneyibacterium aminivorans]|uniref:non-specific serine/threonine protein kinase n=1 Tax=Candidatus Mcinerneyibacterium aminivorans TaxID=2703815 RepID=A0A5D0MIB0_9BACT|nr:MAG: recombinase RecA [Candidatus Mcinerneyibacterium aminivorans]